MIEYTEVWKYRFSELLEDVNPDYVDSTKGDIDYATFIKNTLGLTMEAAYNALDTVSKSFVAFLFNKLMVQERMDSYMRIDFDAAPVSLKADLDVLKWLRLAHTRLVRVALKYGTFLAKQLNDAPSVVRARDSTITATGDGTGNTRTTVSPDNGGTVPPTSFQDWAINDNTSSSSQSEETDETETNSSKYIYEILVDIINQKHDIIEYAEAQLSNLWEYGV